MSKKKKDKNADDLDALLAQIEQATVTPPPAVAPPVDEPKEDKKPTAASKKKPNVGALKKAIELRKQEEDRIAAEEQRLQALEDERIRKAEEQRQLKEAEEERQREVRRQEKEQLKKSGKLLSKAERERQLRNEQYLETLRKQGIPLPAKKDSEAPAPSTKGIVYETKKFSKPKPTASATSTESSTPVEIVSKEEPKENGSVAKEEATTADVKEEDVVDNWEDMLNSSSCSSTSSASESESGTEEEVEEESSRKVPEVKPKATESKPPVKAEVRRPPQTDAAKKKTPVAAHAAKQTTSDSDSSDSGTDSSNSHEDTAAQRERERRREEVRRRREDRVQQAKQDRTKDNLRSPICCILGHVDTGKTKLLDKIRQTNVQGGEAGGITQQIGATFFPVETLIEKTTELREEMKLEIKIPGLLIIDTPGHESFTNLRSRGSSLCNIAILVIDLMHGLEQQTIESINLLRQRKTPFIVALNKIDRMYGWKETPNGSSKKSLQNQSQAVQTEFRNRLNGIVVELAQQGLNAQLYYENDDVRKVVSLVPTSAITGEGIPDLLALLTQLTQNMMSDQLMYLSTLECTVLEVKVVPGHGCTIDVVLSNGVLHEGDRIVLCGMNGPIVTTIRALLTPQPLRELRVKSDYIHNKTVRAALGVKIAAADLDKAIAGSRLLVAETEDEIDDCREEVMADLVDIMSKVDRSGRGVYVQSSTLGSLEALLEFLRQMNIPVAQINIGPIYKKDVMRASVMLETAREYACVLAFDVRIEKDALELADELGVRIFSADIIYHLFDQFKAYMEDLNEKKRTDLAPQAVFPCVLRILPQYVFNRADPIIIGVDIVDGLVRAGTPLCVPSKGGISIGKIVSIEHNHKAVTEGKKGQSVCIKIECPGYDNPKMYGRHFDHNDELVSKISRQSIDILKANFQHQMGKEDWALVIRLKKVFNIT